MSITIKVPTITCEVCANTITKAIKNSINNAEVSIDIEQKLVKIENDISEVKLKEIIIEAGHEPE